MRWPCGAGVAIAVAPGDVFAVHDSDFDRPGLIDAMRALLKAGLVSIEEIGLEPVLH